MRITPLTGGLYNHLMQARTKEQLAKELVKTASDNVALKNRVHELEHELFWMKAAERNQGEENATK